MFSICCVLFICLTFLFHQYGLLILECLYFVVFTGQHLVKALDTFDVLPQNVDQAVLFIIDDSCFIELSAVLYK